MFRLTVAHYAEEEARHLVGSTNGRRMSIIKKCNSEQGRGSRGWRGWPETGIQGTVANCYDR